MPDPVKAEYKTVNDVLKNKSNEPSLGAGLPKIDDKYLYEMRRIVRHQRERDWSSIACNWVRMLLDYINKLEGEYELISNSIRDTEHAGRFSNVITPEEQKDFRDC